MSKNILIVISKFPPEYSGPGVRIPRLYQWFKEKEYNLNINVVCNGIEYNTNKNYVFESLPVRRITAEFLNKTFKLCGFLPKRLTHAVIYQYEFIKTFVILLLSKTYQSIDFLHIAGHSGGTVAALLWARYKKTPVLLELVNASATPYQKFFFFFKVSIPTTGKIAFLTKHTADTYINDGGNPARVWVKPNPIDITKFKIEENLKNSLREKLTPFNSDDIIILSIAKYMPRKNQILLPSVLNFLPEKYKLVIAGPAISQGPLFDRDQKYFQSILDIIEKNNLTHRVHIVSDYVESDLYMKMADIYTMPAWNEGLGTPMLESIACGLPVIANKSEPAFQEWITVGENGFLADINTPKEWSDACIKAVNLDDTAKKTMSKKMHLDISQERIFKEYENLIRFFTAA